MRKVKIICTIGPASRSHKTINRMIRAGMDVARLNFSHGAFAEHSRSVELIRQGARKYDLPVAILQDLRGLKIRVGAVKNDAVMLSKNSVVTLTSKDIEGDRKQLSISYPELVKDVSAGDMVLMDDGLLRLKVIRRDRDRLIARVLEGGLLRTKKGVNFPGTRLSGRAFTDKDRKDLEFGLKMGVDYIAISFVSSKKDILTVRDWLKKHKTDKPIIAKIERPQALENIDEIIDAADGLMIARGDLGVEVPPEDVPLIQKRLIEKCNAAMKPVITATQMLESMTEHMSPTRAEAADVANAVLDGTDALMLSAETAVGRYPVEALRMMGRIIRSTETQRPEAAIGDVMSESFAQAIAEAACITAMDVKAKVIVAFSRTGFTALLASKFRPGVPIVGFTVKESVRRRMNLYWGITPHIMRFPRSTDEMIAETEKALMRKRIVKKGDSIVIIATSPFALGGKTNIMKLHKVGF